MAALITSDVHADLDLSDYEIVFQDEFNGSQLDPTKWSTRHLWGSFRPINGEEQYYVDTLGIDSDLGYSPFEFTGSSLIIKADKASNTVSAPNQPIESSNYWSSNSDFQYNPDYDPADQTYLSGIISTYENFNFSHGYAEMRAVLPKGQGLWSAFWLLTTKYVEDVPELDIMEAIGQFENEVNHTLHYFDTDNNWQLESSPTYKTAIDDYSDSFHTYAVKWEPKKITWYVDDVAVKEITNEDFLVSKQSMYLIANLAVGGSWPGSPDTTTEFPASFEIDYIRAYKRKPVPVINAATLASDYQLMFSDEFNGNSLDFTKWNTHYLWGPYYPINQEEQIYIDRKDRHSNFAIDPFDVSNGTLKISAEKLDSNDIPVQPSSNDNEWQTYPSHQYNAGYGEPDGWTPGYSSGLITSYDNFKFINGYVEARMKLPAGSGAWPAFWLLNGYYVGPQPEIDIMEFRGSEPNKVHHSYHYFNDMGMLQSSAEITTLDGANYSDDFHTYGVQWDRGKVTWYVDGEITRVMQGPEVSTQLMYILINLAIGGNFVEAVDPLTTPATFEIDYVRAYQRNSIDIHSITPDTIAPITTITTPLNADLEPGTDIAGTVLDEGGAGIASVSVFLRDLSTGQYIDLDATSDGDWKSHLAILTNNTGDSANWSVAHSLPIGSYRLWAYAVDNDGNLNKWANSKVIHIKPEKETIAPQSQFTTPSSAAPNLLLNEEITGSSTDEGGSGFAEVRVFIRSNDSYKYVSPNGTELSAWQSFPAQLSNTTVTDTEWSFSHTLPLGNYRIWVYAIDNDGNLSKWSTSTNAKVVPPLDNDAPQTQFADSPLPNNVFNNDSVITGTIQDEGGSGIKAVKIFARDLSTGAFVDLNGTALPSWQAFDAAISDTSLESANWSINQNFPTGSYRVWAYGIDNSNNFSKWSYHRRVNILATVDTIAPTNLITIPAASVTTLNSSADLVGVVTDEGGSGIVNVKVFVRNLKTGDFTNLNGIPLDNWESFSATLSNISTTSVDWSIQQSLPAGTYRISVYGIDNANNFDKWKYSRRLTVE